MIHAEKSAYKSCRAAGHCHTCERCTFLRCPECGAELDLPGELDEGEQVKCLECGGRSKVVYTENDGPILEGGAAEMSEIGRVIFSALVEENLRVGGVV